jgi:hypothetical protein
MKYIGSECAPVLLYIADIPEKGAGGMLEMTARPTQGAIRLKGNSGVHIEQQSCSWCATLRVLRLPLGKIALCSNVLVDVLGAVKTESSRQELSLTILISYHVMSAAA